MTHIEVPADLPGITGLFAFRPETARPLCDLAETLLRADNSLSRGERELIAAYVSRLNSCRFCCDSHSAFAAAQLESGSALVEAVKRDPGSAPVSGKLRALLQIAGKVQQSGQAVDDSDISAARAAGASDVEIHDAVLIAAAFCMFNRYVDGLGTWAPENPDAYASATERIVAQGYTQSTPAAI
jgi:uncharacterized peroxidase-related enzyme